MTSIDTTTPDCLASLMSCPEEATISPRGARFIDEYMIDLNISRACRAAGYKKNSFPTEPAVVRELERRRKHDAETLKISGARVLQEYARCAFLDVSRLFNADGTPKSLHELTSDVRAAISSMDVETQGQDKNWKTVTKYKFVSKMTALEALAKHLGLFPKETQGGDDTSSTNLIGDMSENEQARRISHILHTAMQKQVLLGGVEEAEVIEEG